MPTFSFGEVVLMPFSYTDLRSSKRRPGLVLVDSGDEDVLVAKITTKQYDSQYEILLADWQSAGLFAPSFVRIHKLLAVEKSHIIQHLGRLSSSDLKQVQNIFRMML
jgi:mRNA interferase MazF